MSFKTDIKLDSNYLPVVVNGDFSTCDALDQRTAMALEAKPKDFLQYPAFGADLPGQLNSDGHPANMEREIRRTFEADGLRLSVYKNDFQTIQINSEYA